ncbi:MAG: EamA family transporter RarD [Deltaproteobacteria bacterium]
MKRGILLTIGAYGLWGVLPIYWKQLQSVPSTEIIGHRIVWALVFAVGVVVFKRRLSAVLRTISHPRMVLIYGIAGGVLVVNWTTYVWGVNSGYVVETSLGYFINPLVNVLLGVIFFREHLRRVQWAAICLAAAGVGYLTVRHGSLPWIALVLAFSFGAYGLIKKSAPLEALEGLTLELSLLFVPALLYLLYLESRGVGTFGHAGLSSLLLALGGVVTATPLLMFAGAARRIPLSMLGVLQYIAPTLQFAIGVWVYGEEFSRTRLIGFCFIWAALMIYTAEGLHGHRRKRVAPIGTGPYQLNK